MSGLLGGLPVARAFVVAAIIVASTLATGRSSAQDMLIASDGIKNGALNGCDGGTCSLDNLAIPRASIFYIGLDAELPPPPPLDHARDEIHLRDGSVQPGPLISIDGANVVTAQGVHPRNLVAWVWLTPLLPGANQEIMPSQAPSGMNPDEADAAAPAYLWEGTVKVQNTYAGKLGWHRWQAEYKIKLLETDSGNAPLMVLAPQQIGYQLQADQAYVINWDANDDRSLTMSGSAQGRLSGDDFEGEGHLSGRLVRLDRSLDTEHRQPDSFASYSGDFLPYFKGVMERLHGGSPGVYYMDIGLGRATKSYAEARALYRGINRGGNLPPVVNDPDQEFLDHVPPWMLHFVYLAGRLDNPEQSRVRGAFTLKQEKTWPDEPDTITVEWHFSRTPQ